MTMSIVAGSPVSAESLQAQLGRCVRITGLLQRLACYDGAVKDAGITAPAATRPAPASTVAPLQASPIPAPVRAPTLVAPALASAAPSAAVASNFGAEALPRARRPPSGAAKSIIAGVANLTFDGTGHFTVTLDNGQVWRQMPGDTVILQQTQVASVHIARSVFGSYDLRLPGQHASYRVVRIQ